MKKGVYSIPCSCGKQYIGEMRRSFQVRLKENFVDIRHNQSNKSSLVEHSQNTRHHICIEDTKIIAKLEHHGKIKIWEALEIELKMNNMKRDEGLNINKSWNHVLHILKINNNPNK